MGTIINEESLIIGNQSSEALERNQKEEIYMNYIKDHIAKVKKCYEMYFIPLKEVTAISSLVSDEELKDAIDELGEIIDTHDASKFTDAEFGPYRAKWYPTLAEQNADLDYQELMEDKYEDAWKHHYETNDHHPMHWVNPETGVSSDMSLRAIIEMLCDWEAVSLKVGTSTVEWYKNDAKEEKAAMTPNTKDIVEDLLFNVLHGNSAE